MNNETKVGILIVIVLVILFSLTVRAGDFHLSQQGYTVRVRFQNIDGVELNSPVMLNGLEVGRVTDIRIDYGAVPKLELTLWVKDGVKIARGVKAMVKNMGFMGEKYVGLVMQQGEQGFLSPGESIEGLEPASFENILREGEDIATNIRDITENINERLRINAEAIDGVIADMRKTMGDIATVSGNIEERFSVNEHLVDEMMLNIRDSSKNLEELSYDLKENPWKLLYRPKKVRR